MVVELPYTERAVVGTGGDESLRFRDRHGEDANLPNVEGMRRHLPRAPPYAQRVIDQVMTAVLYCSQPVRLKTGSKKVGSLSVVTSNH